MILRTDLTTLLAWLFLLNIFALRAFAFSFWFTSAPSQCASVTVQWNGGTAPFTLLLVPVGSLTPETRKIIQINVSSGTSTTFTLNFPAQSQFVAVLSDATGIGTGGTSAVMTVGSSSDSSCLNQNAVTPEFYLYMSPTSVSECGSVSFSWQSAAQSPVSIIGLIPGGDSFQIASVTDGSLSTQWTADVSSGTDVLFVAGDKNGLGTGGSTDIMAISGGSSSCLNNNSPSSTAGSPAGGIATPTSGSSSGGAGGQTGQSGSSGSQSGSGNSGNSDSSSSGGSNGSGNSAGGSSSQSGSNSGTGSSSGGSQSGGNSDTGTSGGNQSGGSNSGQGGSGTGTGTAGSGATATGTNGGDATGTGTAGGSNNGSGNNGNNDNNGNTGNNSNGNGKNVTGSGGGNVTGVPETDSPLGGSAKFGLIFGLVFGILFAIAMLIGGYLIYRKIRERRMARYANLETGAPGPLESGRASPSPRFRGGVSALSTDSLSNSLYQSEPFILPTNFTLRRPEMSARASSSRSIQALINRESAAIPAAAAIPGRHGPDSSVWKHRVSVGPHGIPPSRTPSGRSIPVRPGRYIPAATGDPPTRVSRDSEDPFGQVEEPLHSSMEDEVIEIPPTYHSVRRFSRRDNRRSRQPLLRHDSTLSIDSDSHEPALE